MSTASWPRTGPPQPDARARRAWLALVAAGALLLAVPADAQLYDFNAGNIAYGWTLAGAYVDANNPCSALTPVADNLTGMFWSDTTNYPTRYIGEDPAGNSAGAIRFDTSANGDGVAGPGTYWYVLLTSPDLTSVSTWQHVYGVRVRLIANMGSGTNFANVIVRVFDLDQQRDRCFFSGNLTAITKSSWTTWTLDWSGISTFPTRYTVKNVYVDVAGELIQSYTTGSIWIDNVEGFADTVAPTVSITTPTSGATYDTFLATVDLGGTAGDTGGSTLTRVDWSNAATKTSGTATGTTSWSASGIALVPGLNVITVTAWDKAQNTATDEVRVTLLPPGGFNKTAPANGATGLAPDQTLSWDTSSGATAYAYCYDTTNDNECSGWASTGTSTSATLKSLTPGATYYWQVRATGPGGTTYANGGPTAFWSFRVVPLPGAFSKSSPANGGSGVASNPTLSWGASSDAASYAYCYDTSNDNACSSWVSAGTSTSVALSGLSPGTTYYWHVRATNASGTTYANGSSTAFWSFAVLPLPGSFSKSSPANGAAGVAPNPTLSWGASSNAASYAYCYDTSNDNACSSWVSAGTSTSVALSGLSPGTTYYWHVRATNASGTTYASGSSTAFWSFTVLPAAGTFSKSAPANGATGVSASPTLSWEVSPGAASYAYCYDTSNDNACSSWVSAGTSTSVALSGLSPGTTYYWHVRATNLAGTTYANGSATAFWSFTVLAPTYALTVQRAGLGLGTVNSVPGGITCGKDCGESFASGARVTLTATASLGSAFAGWTNCPSASGNRCSLTMTAPLTVTAAFSRLGTTRRIEAGKPSLDGNGHYLAFVSTRTDLVEGDTNLQPDVFVRDTTNGSTVRVSVGSSGRQADGPSDEPAISASGRYVAFLSAATNLVPGDTNGVTDVFLHDRDTDADGVFDEPGAIQTRRVSLASSGAQANGACGPPDISPDGLWVVFPSTASTLAPGDTNGVSDVFLHHWPSGQTLLVSTGPHGLGNGSSVRPAVSDRAEVVVFASDATNLDPADTNGVRDIFRWERATRQLVRLTGGVDDDRPQADGASDRPDVSDDGRVVAFQTLATNLSSWADTNQASDVVVLRPAPVAGIGALAPASEPPPLTANDVVSITDLLRQLASQAANGGTGNGSSSQPAVNADGTEVAFSSDASNLDEPGTDENENSDVYVSQEGGDHPAMVPDEDTSTPADANQEPAISGDGSYVAFEQQSGGSTDPEVLVTGPSLMVTGMSPGSGLVTGGFTVAFDGAGFTAAVQVTIGGNLAQLAAVNSENRMVVIAPAATAPGPADVTVTVGGETVSFAGAFTYLPEPEDVPPADYDGDSLPDDWETRFGLDATSAAGDNGATGDPDHDGLTNAQEWQSGSHPTAVFTRYFAEGATAPVFETEISVTNPGTQDAAVLLRFQRSDGTERSDALAVPARSSRTVHVGQLPDMASRQFATVVESDVPVVADRVMTWDRPTQYGSHVETAVPAPALVWYLAEGATHWYFDLYYLLQNPNPVEAQVRVRYLRPAPLPPLEKTMTLAPTSRTNIWVDGEEFPAEPDPHPLASTDVSAVIEVLNAVPIIVERAMYLSLPGELFTAGHESAGVTAPATQWFLAEGSTQGHFFDLFILIANPSAQAADVEARYLLSDGTVITTTREVAAESRANIWVNLEDARLADAAISTVVTSTNGVPIIVERAMWWPGGRWYEGHNSPGNTVTGTAWGVAAGRVTTGTATATETYILVANTSAHDGDVAVTLLFEDGQAPVTRTFHVLANSRLTVNALYDFPEAIGRRFGAVVEALGDDPPQIAVERAIYSNARGEFWSAGGNSLATRLR